MGKTTPPQLGSDLIAHRLFGYTLGGKDLRNEREKEIERKREREREKEREKEIDR